VRLFGVGDEELRAVTVRTIVSHGHHTTHVVLKQTQQTTTIVRPEESVFDLYHYLKNLYLIYTITVH
jgi:hypothetical protein